MSWETWEIKDHVLEYNDENHLYICDGMIVPSVTQLMSRRFGRKYDGVPRYVLNNAARLGNMIHHAIEKAEALKNAEDYILSPDEGEIADEFRSYLAMKKRWKFTVEGNEMPLLIPYKGEIIAAGRMDLLLMNKDGKLGVADIKRTAKLDESYLRYQTTLYGMGVKYCYNIDPQFYACVWLRKKESAYRILRPDERLVNLLLEEVWNENQSKATITYGGVE